jgi:hypothetical protein
MDPDRRDAKPDRRTLIHRIGGRRETDTGTRADLLRMADVAEAQGKTSIAQICRRALAIIDDLEAEILRVRGNAKKGAQTRLTAMSAAQRKGIAQRAARSRWDAQG